MIRKLITAAALVIAPAASAATYNVTSGFGTSVFAYGSGVGGSSFAAFSNHFTCVTNLDCYDNGGLPQVIKNTGATPFAFSTLVIPANSVDFHPGPGGGATDSIVRFIAPTAGTYSISGLFARNDVTPSGNGTIASVFSNIGGTYALLFSTGLAANSYGSSTSFGVLSTALGAGDTIDFVLNNNNGEYTFDSTRLDATLSVGGVPEPAAWGMLLAGFAMTGAAMRRRSAALAA